MRPLFFNYVAREESKQNNAGNRMRQKESIGESVLCYWFSFRIFRKGEVSFQLVEFCMEVIACSSCAHWA